MIREHFMRDIKHEIQHYDKTCTVTSGTIWVCLQRCKVAPCNRKQTLTFRERSGDMTCAWQAFGTTCDLPTHLDRTRSSTWGVVETGWHTNRRLGHFNRMRHPNVLSWVDLVLCKHPWVVSLYETCWIFAFRKLCIDLQNQTGLSLLLPPLKARFLPQRSIVRI